MSEHDGRGTSAGEKDGEVKGVDDMLTPAQRRFREKQLAREVSFCTGLLTRWFLALHLLELPLATKRPSSRAGQEDVNHWKLSNRTADTLITKDSNSMTRAVQSAEGDASLISRQHIVLYAKQVQEKKWTT